MVALLSAERESSLKLGMTGSAREGDDSESSCMEEADSIILASGSDGYHDEEELHDEVLI